MERTFLYSENLSTLINLRHVIQITLDGYTVYVFYSNSGTQEVRYESEEEAKEKFDALKELLTIIE